MSGRKHIPNMSETAIDQSKLPGVKEVCRDFAVLEDHSLAHNLQEQEIEHHLTTNILRNRLVKNDLHVAKQLQEQEDLRTQARMKNRHNELEVLDSEIAQEIQDKLVIEAEHRRQQEEKDEDIARLLQEREERRRKKYYPPSQEEPSYKDREGFRSKGARDAPISKHMSGLRNQEEHDAHLARRLQEKELRVNIVDKRAAQMAQDEEIARYIMDKEEKAYKKSKGGGKMSDAKRPEELEASDHVRQRSREGHDHHHRSRSDKPYRPLHPPRDTAEDDYDDDYTNINQHNSPRSSSKSQSSLKGAYYRP
ncbi:coiled-coil domain-containing protein 50 isoform X2 [Xenopus laevis]|uniref:Coiled-coil domain-containing protein 50 isoform X2 n=1 Tax=Xenopus laevis TaxID=8355 RepID=A0A8J0U727_XENLA|nr:coiled-coil domain-containing protein 50 isoform X2 [Xenopus laevis]